MEGKIFFRHTQPTANPISGSDLPILQLIAPDSSSQNSSPLKDRQERNRVATASQNMMIDLSNYTNSITPDLYRNALEAGGTLTNNGVQFTAENPITMTTRVHGLFQSETESKEIAGTVSPTDLHHINMTITTRDLQGKITAMKRVDVRYKGFFSIEEVSVDGEKPTRRLHLLRQNSSNVSHKVPAIGRPQVRTTTLAILRDVDSDIRQLLAGNSPLDK